MVEVQSMTTVADVVAAVREGRLDDPCGEVVLLVARELMEGVISADIGRSPASRALQGGATERSAASSEACRAVSVPACGRERGRAEPRRSRRRPWKG
jgi:hypothetical protein